MKKNKLKLPIQKNPLRWRQPVRRQPEGPVLRFSPTAWAKLQFFCHAGETEIGGFGVANDSKHLLCIDDFVTVRQATSPVSVVFDDLSVADYFEQQVDMGHKPEQFARVWLHTHPGDCPYPSGTDEETFARVFGNCDWAVMFILAKGGQTYCRLRFNTGPGGQLEIPVQVDYRGSFAGSDHEGWGAEFELNVQPELHPLAIFGADGDLEGAFGMDSMDALIDVVDERGQIELLMDEYGVDSDADLLSIIGNGSLSGDNSGGRGEVPA
jgi:proteasome lid subunit RPN8/RPN11